MHYESASCPQVLLSPSLIKQENNYKSIKEGTTALGNPSKKSVENLLTGSLNIIPLCQFCFIKKRTLILRLTHNGQNRRHYEGETVHQKTKMTFFQLIMENLHSLRCEAGSWSGGQCWCAAGPLVQETVARTGEPGDQISSVRGHHPPHLHPRTSPSAIRCTERRQPVETQPTAHSQES